MARPPHLPFRWTVALLGAAASLLALTAALSAQWSIPVATFTRDLAAVTEVHPMTGVISNLGILGWAAAATVCAFTAFVLDRRAHRELWTFFVASTALSGVLLFDDLFMLHDFPYPWVAAQEELFLGSYVLLAGAFFARFRAVLVTFDIRTLGLALVFFATSLGVDQVLDSEAGWRLLLEDGAKFLGIVAWLAFFLGAALSVVRPGHGPAQETAGSA